jgi:4-hydroxy-tetrahydrodipicolinate synthase
MTDGTPAAPFGAVLTAMVTPFDERGALDLDAAAALARWLVDHGSDGLVVAGTTGEGPVLDDAEKLDLFGAVAEAVSVPVLGGASSNDTAHSVELTRRAGATGIDGVLVVTPYYNRPSQAGLLAHFEAVAAATTLPVCLYDIPVRTGRRIAADTLLSLARRIANVVAVKDATGDVVGAGRLVAEAPPGFSLYSGDDAFTLPLLSVGAVGVVSVASHWVGPQMGAMLEAFAAGRVEEARRRNAELAPSFAFESSEEFPNPLPVKAACRALGLAVGQCRPPMGPAPEVLDGRARQLLERTGAPAAQPVG